MDVRALSNCEEVELFLNGQSLGRQTMKKDSELKWKVKYAPGMLSAKGYKNGQLAAETKVETTGAPAAIQLTPDRSAINANGEDVSVFTVAVTDAQGRVVPVAANLIHFGLSGPGKILGVGNGDPSCHEPDVFLPVWTNYSVAANDSWRWKRFPIRGIPASRKPPRHLTTPPGPRPMSNRPPARWATASTRFSAPISM